MIADILEDVLALARPIQQTAGVYFLIHKGRVVYVGQSGACESRIQNHYSEGIKDFDSFTIVAINGNRIRRLRIEKDLIESLHPHLNFATPEQCGLIPLSDVSRSTGHGMGNLLALVKEQRIPYDYNRKMQGETYVRKDRIFAALERGEKIIAT